MGWTPWSKDTDKDGKDIEAKTKGEIKEDGSQKSERLSREPGGRHDHSISKVDASGTRHKDIYVGENVERSREKGERGKEKDSKKR